MVRINQLAGAVAATAIGVGVAAGTVAPASAANNIKPFGQQETLNDSITGAPMIGYTLSGLSRAPTPCLTTASCTRPPSPSRALAVGPLR